MKRRNLTPKENAKNIVFTEYGLRQVILREPSIVDEFYREKSKSSDDSQECVGIVDPIIMLFNQERLNQLGSMGAQQFLDALAPRSNPLQELRKKCSDEDLLCMIKSKHLQSPAEILSWCRYMDSNVETFNSAVQEILKQKQESQTTVNVEPQNVE